MNRGKIKTCLLSSILFMFSVSSGIAGDGPFNDEPYKMFFEANRAYKEGAYQQAVSGYEALIHRGFRGGDIMYNLGNCYVRMNRLGKAILNYERAKRLLPRDPDLDLNLRYARDRIKDLIERPSGLSPFPWIHVFSRSEVFWSFAVINLLFWLTLILRVWVRSEWSFYLLMGFGILWAIMALSGGVKWYQDAHDRRGVVIAPEINVHAGPDERDTTLFRLHAGAIVICEREEDGWELVQLTPERRGWTRAEFVEGIF